MIGVICPSAFEYEMLNVDWPAMGAQVVLSGMGKLRALEACHKLNYKNDLRAILLLGFAGSLSDSLDIGDVIEPSVFIEQDYNVEPFEIFPNQVLMTREKLLAESKKAALLTQDRFLKENPYRGSKMETRYGALACDMEAYAVAYFGKTHGISCSVVKLISDRADDTAEHDFLKACRELAPKLNRVVSEALEEMHRRAAGKIERAVLK